ncbi:hypothetical protein Tco_0484647 [Tanacetum coccineum]
MILKNINNNVGELVEKHFWRDTSVLGGKTDKLGEVQRNKTALQFFTRGRVSGLSASCVEEMKKKCMDKGWMNKEAPPHNLRQKPGQYICCQNHKLIADIENDIMDPVAICSMPPSTKPKFTNRVPPRAKRSIKSQHPSDTNVFTMKMEILLEPASNKLLVESKEQDTSSRSGNDAHVDDADIRPINNEEPMAEVQMTADDNVSATGQQHTEQPEFINEGEVDQNAEQCHDIRPLPAKLTDNRTTELSNQLLESDNERHSPLAQQRLKVNPQMVQMQIFPHQCKANKLLKSGSSSLGRQCQMASAENNTSGPVPQCLMTSVHISSGLVLHQMTSDHNRSELGIQDHSNEQSSSKLVPKVVP